MRQIIDKQMTIGQVAIEDIQLNLKSRDSLEQLLRGIQHIFCIPEIREKSFKILEKIMPPGKGKEIGRPGMPMWCAFVMGMLRSNMNWNYDRLCSMVNSHREIRQMLGHSIFDDTKYCLQTIRDNVRLFTPEVLKELNVLFVKAGHKVVGQESRPHNVKYDSYVLETDVHFPTDRSLLWDSTRKLLSLMENAGDIVNLRGWRKSNYLRNKIKGLYNRVRRLRRSNSKNAKKRARRDQHIKEFHQEYADECQKIVFRAVDTLDELQQNPNIPNKLCAEISKYIYYAQLLIDQMIRRVIYGESIPQEEKVFSVFEEHTEWIVKGKAGVRQELGVRLSVGTDQHQFILTGKLMFKQTDEKVTIELVEDTIDHYGDVNSASFDKGFYSPANREKLEKLVNIAVLPKKGKLTKKEKRRMQSQVYRDLRRQHSAVESSINALECHGLDRCLDRGIEAMKRYVWYCFAGRNLQILGKILLDRERDKRKGRRHKDITSTLAA